MVNRNRWEFVTFNVIYGTLMTQIFTANKNIRNYPLHLCHPRPILYIPKVNNKIRSGINKIPSVRMNYLSCYIRCIC
jgi:hypothetical protein